jgi:hypothetical protein
MQKMKAISSILKLTIFSGIIFSCSIAIGQLKLADNKTSEKITPKELTIPTSPLFDLMGVAPSQVARTAAIKDFKVDWSFKSWKLNPNLAIETQPIWELFYNRKNLEKYQKAAGIQRMLASLDLSVGTVQTENNDRRIGGALKLNLYKQKDPLLVKHVYDDIQTSFEEELKALKAREKGILKNLDSLTKPGDLKTAREELDKNDQQLTTYYSRRNAAIQEKAASFISDNWNASYVDLAYGSIYTYNTDSSGDLRKLQLNRNTGKGAWINFGLGIGKRGLISGLARTSFYEEEVTFTMKDNASGEEVEQKAVAANRLISLGLNFRYGGPVYNFFIEFIREGKTLKTPSAALGEAFKTPTGKSIITSTVKWDVVQPYTLNFGGDWRVSRNVILNYGIRCLMDNNFKTTSFIPIVNISCMMR